MLRKNKRQNMKWLVKPFMDKGLLRLSYNTNSFWLLRRLPTVPLKLKTRVAFKGLEKILMSCVSCLALQTRASIYPLSFHSTH